LNVESGLNDGLALPVVVVLLAVVGPAEAYAGRIIGELMLGIALGVVVPWVGIALERSRFFSAATGYEPLNAFAIGLVLFALANLTHGNEFLAAFAGGVTVASTSTEVRDAFTRFGELITELLKLAALLVFGALISPAFLGEISLRGYAFALAALVVARPVAIGLSLIGTRLGLRESVAAPGSGRRDSHRSSTGC